MHVLHKALLVRYVMTHILPKINIHQIIICVINNY